MRAGALRHSITIQQTDETRSATGSVTNTWSTFAKVRAEVRPTTGIEQVAGDQVVADVTHQVRIRWYDGVTPKMRVLFGRRVLEIIHVINLFERDREMNLLCREIL